MRRKSIILMSVIVGIMGIGILVFLTTIIEEYSTSESSSFNEMSCLQLLFYEYGPEYKKLSEQEIQEYRQARAPCLDT